MIMDTAFYPVQFIHSMLCTGPAFCTRKWQDFELSGFLFGNIIFFQFTQLQEHGSVTIDQARLLKLICFLNSAVVGNHRACVEGVCPTFMFLIVATLVL